MSDSLDPIALVSRYINKRGFYVSSYLSPYNQGLYVVKRHMSGWRAYIRVDKLKVTLEASNRFRVRSGGEDKVFDLYNPDSLPKLLEAIQASYTLTNLSDL